MSRIQPLWLPPIATRGNHLLSINIHGLHFPHTPYLWLITGTGVFTLTLVYIAVLSNHPIAKSCSAMQTFPSVLLPCMISPCMTWTVYWTLILCRLPILIQPALLSDYTECLPPALILSLNSDCDSALPTLCLKLVIEFCLSDLHSVLIKLHMDPNVNDSSFTEDFARLRSSSILPLLHRGLCPSVGPGHTPATAQPTNLSDRRTGKDFASTFISQRPTLLLHPLNPPPTHSHFHHLQPSSRLPGEV